LQYYQKEQNNFFILFERMMRAGAYCNTGNYNLETIVHYVGKYAYYLPPLFTEMCIQLFSGEKLTNLCDQTGKTMFHYLFDLCEKGSSFLDNNRVYEENLKKTIKKLIHYGFDPRIMDNKNNSIFFDVLNKSCDDVKEYFELLLTIFNPKNDLGYYKDDKDLTGKEFDEKKKAVRVFLYKKVND
jgi:hypothetical protein